MFGFSRTNSNGSALKSPDTNSQTASPRDNINNNNNMSSGGILQVTPPTPQYSSHGPSNRNNDNTSGDSRMSSMLVMRSSKDEGSISNSNNNKNSLPPSGHHQQQQRRTSDASIIAQRISSQQQQQNNNNNRNSRNGTPRMGSTPEQSRSNTPGPQPSLLPPAARSKSPTTTSPTKNMNIRGSSSTDFSSNKNASRFSDRALRLSAENFDFNTAFQNSNKNNTAANDNNLAFSIPSPSNYNTQRSEQQISPSTNINNNNNSTARRDRSESPNNNNNNNTNPFASAAPPPRRITTAAGQPSMSDESPTKFGNNKRRDSTSDNNNHQSLTRQSSTKSMMSMLSLSNQKGRFQRIARRKSHDQEQQHQQELPPSLFAQRQMLKLSSGHNVLSSGGNKPDTEDSNGEGTNAFNNDFRGSNSNNALNSNPNQQQHQAINNWKRPSSSNAAVATAAAVVDSGIFAWIVRCSLMSTMPIRDLNKFMTDSLRVIDRLVERAAQVSIAHFAEQHEKSILEQSFFGARRFSSDEDGDQFKNNNNNDTNFTPPQANKQQQDSLFPTRSMSFNSTSMKSRASSQQALIGNNNNNNSNNPSNVNPLSASPEQRKRMTFLNAHQEEDEYFCEEDEAPRSRANDMESNYQNLVDDAEVEMAEREIDEKSKKGKKDDDDISSNTSSSAVTIDPDENPILFLMNPLNLFFEAIRKLPASSFRKYSATSAFASTGGAERERHLRDNIKIGVQSDPNLLDLHEANTIQDVAFYEAVTSLADLWFDSNTQRDKLKALFSIQQQVRLLVQGSEAVAALSQRSRCIVIHESFFSNPITDAEKVPGLALAIFVFGCLASFIVFFMRAYLDRWKSNQWKNEIDSAEPNLHNGLVGLFVISFIVLVGSFIIIYRKFTIRKVQMRQILNTILYADTLSGHRLATTTSKHSSPNSNVTPNVLSNQPSHSASFVRHSQSDSLPKSPSKNKGKSIIGSRAGTTSFPVSPLLAGKGLSFTTSNGMMTKGGGQSSSFESGQGADENNNNNQQSVQQQDDLDNQDDAASANYDYFNNYNTAGDDQQGMVNSDPTTKSILDAVFGTVGGMVWGGQKKTTTAAENNNIITNVNTFDSRRASFSADHLHQHPTQQQKSNANKKVSINSGRNSVSNNANNNGAIVVQNSESYLEHMPGGVMILPFQSNSYISSAPANPITSIVTSPRDEDENELSQQYSNTTNSMEFPTPTSAANNNNNKRSQKASAQNTNSNNISQVQAHGVFRSSHQDNFAPDQLRSSALVSSRKQQNLQNRIPTTLCFDLLEVHKLLFIVCFDYRYTVTAWNNAAELVTGFLARECIGKKLQEIINISEDILTSLTSRMVSKREHVMAQVQSLNTGISILKGTIVSTHDTDQYFGGNNNTNTHHHNQRHRHSSNQQSNTGSVGFAFISAVQASDDNNRASSLVLNFKNSLARQTVEALSIECRSQLLRRNSVSGSSRPSAPNKTMQHENSAIQLYRKEVAEGVYPTHHPLPPTAMVDVLRYIQALRVLIRGSTWENIHGLAQNVQDDWEIFSPEQILSSSVRYHLNKVVESRCGGGNMALPKDLRVSMSAITVARAMVNACPGKCRVVIAGEEAGKRTRRLIISVESVAATLKVSNSNKDGASNLLLTTTTKSDQNNNVLLDGTANSATTAKSNDDSAIPDELNSTRPMLNNSGTKTKRSRPKSAGNNSGTSREGSNSQRDEKNSNGGDSSSIRRINSATFAAEASSNSPGSAGRKRPKSASVVKVATASRQHQKQASGDLLSLNDRHNNNSSSVNNDSITKNDDDNLPNLERSYSELLSDSQRDKQQQQQPQESSVAQQHPPLLQTNSDQPKPFDFDSLLTEVWETLAKASGVLVPSSDAMSVMLYLPCISSKLFGIADASSAAAVGQHQDEQLVQIQQQHEQRKLVNIERTSSFIGENSRYINNNNNQMNNSITNNNSGLIKGGLGHWRDQSFSSPPNNTSQEQQFNNMNMNNNYNGQHQLHQTNFNDQYEEAKCPISVAMLFDNAVDVHNLTSILFSIKNVSVAVCQSEQDLINRLPFCDLILVDWDLLPEIEEKKPVLKKQLYVLPCVSQEWEPLEAGMESQVIFRPFDRNLIVNRIVEASELVLSNREEDRKNTERERILTARNDAPWTRGRLLGKGSFGTVYEAINDMTGGVMAVKCFDLQVMRDRASMDGDPDAQFERIIKSLMNEISILCKLSHPHIVHYFYSEKTDNTLNLFMEMCDRSLQDIISARRLNRGRLEVAAPTIARQTLQAVAYLHDKGIIHRDLKPMNILLRGDTLKLTDFGTAAQLTSTNEQLTGMQGTFAFMSPEVASGQSYNASCDLWSLGCIMAEVLHLNLPFMDQTNPMMMMGYFNNNNSGTNDDVDAENSAMIPTSGPVQLPPVSATFSAEARDFVSLCLQVRPEDRPLASALLLHPYVDLGSDGQEALMLSTLKGGERKTTGSSTTAASSSSATARKQHRSRIDPTPPTTATSKGKSTQQQTSTTIPRPSSTSPTPRNIEPTPRHGLEPLSSMNFDHTTSNLSVFTSASPLSIAPTPREGFDAQLGPSPSVPKVHRQNQVHHQHHQPQQVVVASANDENNNNQHVRSSTAVHQSSVLSSTSGFLRGRQEDNDENHNQHHQEQSQHEAEIAQQLAGLAVEDDDEVVIDADAELPSMLPPPPPLNNGENNDQEPPPPPLKPFW